MTNYIAKRILTAFITLLGITVIDFFIMSLMGNPIEIMSGGPKVNQGALVQKASNLGLDQPIVIQYFNWLGQIIHGNFGTSYRTYESVSSMISSHLWPTLLLQGTSLILGTLIAVLAGIYSAIHQHQKRDYAIVTAAFIGESIPGFFLSMVFIYLFSVKLGWLPGSGIKTLGSGNAFEWKYLVMPCLVLSIGVAGSNIRYIRSSMLEILNEDYLRTAKGKGIGRKMVIYKHGLRNALIPIVTVIGMEIPSLFGGSVIIEQMFSWPGLGLMTMNAILGRDYPVIMAVCLLSAVVVLIGNLITDILYAVVDPTVTYHQEG